MQKKMIAAALVSALPHFAIQAASPLSNPCQPGMTLIANPTTGIQKCIGTPLPSAIGPVSIGPISPASPQSPFVAGPGPAIVGPGPMAPPIPAAQNWSPQTAATQGCAPSAPVAINSGPNCRETYYADGSYATRCSAPAAPAPTIAGPAPASPFVAGPSASVVAGPSQTAPRSNSSDAEINAFIAKQGQTPNPYGQGTIADLWRAQGVTDPYSDPRVRAQAQGEVVRQANIDAIRSTMSSPPTVAGPVAGPSPLVAGPAPSSPVAAAAPAAMPAPPASPTASDAAINAFIAKQGQSANPYGQGTIADVWRAQGITDPYSDPRVRAQAQGEVVRQANIDAIRSTMNSPATVAGPSSPAPIAGPAAPAANPVVGSFCSPWKTTITYDAAGTHTETGQPCGS